MIRLRIDGRDVLVGGGEGDFHRQLDERALEQAYGRDLADRYRATIEAVGEKAFRAGERHGFMDGDDAAMARVSADAGGLLSALTNQIEANDRQGASRSINSLRAVTQTLTPKQKRDQRPRQRERQADDGGQAFPVRQRAGQERER